MSLTKRSTTNTANIDNYNNAGKDLVKAYNTEQTKYLQLQIHNVQAAADNKQSALAWNIVNSISGRKTFNRAKLKANNQTEWLNKWKDHFSTLLFGFSKLFGLNQICKVKNINPVREEELPIETGQFTMKELEIVLKGIRLKKAAGLDEIPPEVWKTGLFNTYLLEFCNDVYNQSTIDEWRKGCILPLPKKGDLSKWFSK